MGGGLAVPDPNAPDPGLAGDLVEARFGLSTDLVNQYDAASTSALGLLASGTFSVPMANLDLKDETLSPPTIGDAPVPNQVPAYTSQAEVVSFPDITALRNLLGLVDITIDQVSLPSLDAISPTISFPDAPDDALPTVPTEAPAISDPSLPVSPTLDLPPVPVLEEATLPAVPNVNDLTFTGEMPTADLTVPEPMFAYSEGTYQSDLADAIRTKLYNDITLGTAVYTEEVWTAVWNRSLSRLNTELDKVYRQTLANWGAWNCEMPDGVLSGALQEVMFEDAEKRLNANRDITYKQAELTQQATQFAITSGNVFEKQLMDYTNQVNDRALEAAKTRVLMVVEAFKLKVQAYTAQLEGYKTLAQVFEARIRAELARVELYRAQMEGAKIHGELQEQKVRIYTARVNAVQVLIDLYRAQMEGAKLQVDVDRSKIEAFKAKIEAIVASINGVTAKYNLYQAQLTGEATKVDLYGKQVQAYATQVSAVKTIADVNLAQAQALIESNKDKIGVLTAAIERYKADTSYELGKDETGAKVYTAQISGYEAEVGRETEYIKAKVDNFKAQVTEVMARAELIVKEMDANLRAATAAKEIQMEALKAAAAIQAQKVASALTSVSASAQIGFNASLSDAYSRSTNYSDIYTTGHSENHNYNYSM